MTQEQKDFTEANHNLIYSFMNLHNLNSEEYYDVLAISLCNAAITFDKDKGFTFSTYAFKCMQNEIFKEGRTKLLKRRIPEGLIYSLDAKYSSSEAETYSLSDKIPTQKDSIEELINKIDLQEALKKLNPMEYNVIYNIFFNNLSEMELAKKLSISKQRINIIKHDAFRKIKIFLSVKK